MLYEHHIQIKGKNVVKEKLLAFKKLSSLIRHYFIQGCFISSFMRKFICHQIFSLLRDHIGDRVLNRTIHFNKLNESPLPKLTLLTFCMYLKKRGCGG